VAQPASEKEPGAACGDCGEATGLALKSQCNASIPFHLAHRLVLRYRVVVVAGEVVARQVLGAVVQVGVVAWWGWAWHGGCMVFLEVVVATVMAAATRKVRASEQASDLTKPRSNSQSPKAPHPPRTCAPACGRSTEAAPWRRGWCSSPACPPCHR